MCERFFLLALGGVQEQVLVNFESAKVLNKDFSTSVSRIIKEEVKSSSNPIVFTNYLHPRVFKL